MRIGILALQGAVVEHRHKMEQLGHEVVEVRSKEDIEHIHGIILPGGESTTMSKLLLDTGLMIPLREKIQSGLPVLATCAGLILLAKEIEGDALPTLGILNIKVARNAFGRQLGSFMREESIEGVSDNPIPLIFIRGPIITKVGKGVEVLHRIDRGIVAVRQGNIMALAFHPELTDDITVHSYFLDNVITSINTNGTTKKSFKSVLNIFS